MRALKFQVVDSCVQPMNAPVNLLEKLTLAQFLDKPTRGSNPRLIYVGKNMMPSLLKDVRKEAAKHDFAVVVPPFAASVYRDLKKDQIYIIKAVDARGLDFSASDGIDLLVMASSPSHRAY